MKRKEMELMGRVMWELEMVVMRVVLLL